MSALSIIIPAYNEEGAIAEVVQRAKNLPIETEVIVVDDGSTDQTASIAEQSGALVVRHPTNGGYGLALKSGISAASNELLAITDADGTYPIEDLPSLMQKVQEGFHLAVGARTGAAYWGTFLKMPARFVFKFLVEFSTGKRIPDINSGLRVFRRSDVIPLFPFLCDTFSFTTTQTLVYCFLHKFIYYQTIRYNKRVGKSKVRFIRDSVRTLQYITESIVNFNPIKLFLLISMIFVLLSFISILMWAANFFPEGTSISALLFLCTSGIIFCMGLQADVALKTRKMNIQRHI